MNVELIHWVDCSGYDGWHDPEASAVTHITSIGWITDETEEAITVTSHIDETNDSHHADMTIPKVSIVKRLVIDKSGK